MNNWYKTAATYDFKPGDVCWFEYHCWESPQSSDAELWYHSHQKVKILKLVEKGVGKTIEERFDNTQLAAFRVQFADGFQAEAAEDELYKSPSGFYRPAPPKPKQKLRR